MKSLQNKTRRTSLAWVRRLLAAALVAAFTSASSGIYISNLRITGVSPSNEIQCGTSAWVTVKFEYYIANPNKPTQTGTVKIWEDDWGSDVWISSNTYTISGSQQGTKTVTVEICCDPKNDYMDCELSGRDGTDEGEGGYEIYAEIPQECSNAESDNVTVYCDNFDGNIGYQDHSIYPGGMATTGASVRPTGGIAHIDWGIAYDHTYVLGIGAAWDPQTAALFEWTNVDMSVPGLIRFQAENPTNVPLEPLNVEIEFLAAPDAPYEIVLLDTTTESVFMDELFDPVGLNYGRGQLAVVPEDTTPPSIDPSLISFDMSGQQITGEAGAVLDDYAYLDPEWVTLEVYAYPPLRPDVPYLVGSATVEPDGSFLIDGWRYFSGQADMHLVAKDYLGNESDEVVLPVECPHSEDVEAYPDGSDLHGQGGWQGWDNDPAFGAVVTQDQFHSPVQSVDIKDAADLVHQYCAHESGLWSYSAWQYIPSDFQSGGGDPPVGTFFVMLSDYNDGGPYFWTVQCNFDSNDGMLKVYYGNGMNTVDVPYTPDEWVELQTIVDLDNDWTRFYYEGDLIAEYSWTGGVLGDGGGELEINAVDLFAQGSTSVYYDDLVLEPIVGCGTELSSDEDLDGLDLLTEFLIGTNSCNPDTDDDGYLDGEDNCPLTYNPDQNDIDGDGIGDVCDETPSCYGDVNWDGKVNIDDIFSVLAAWGPCGDCPEDLNENGNVDIDDLFEVLAHWGPCDFPYAAPDRVLQQRMSFWRPALFLWR